MTTPLEILVRGPNWTGDVVMSTPAFRALREHYPRDRITLQLRPGLTPLLAGSPWFDEVIPVQSYQQGAVALWREGRALQKRRRYDLGICLPDSWSSALLMRAAGVRRICGYRRTGRGILLHTPVTPRPEWGRRRLVAREVFALELMKTLGCDDSETALELFTTPEEEAQADRLLEGATTAEPKGLVAPPGSTEPATPPGSIEPATPTGLSSVRQGGESNGPLLVLAPGASFGPSKCWAPESFAEVGDAASREGARVAVVGTREESALVASVCSAMREPALNLAGALDLGALKALMRRAAALVCNDAGARHIAVAFGVPCVVLMGPTSLEKTAANLAAVHVLQTDVACRPCYKRECPIDHRCMTRIEASEVSAITLPLLERAVRANQATATRP